MSTPYEYQIYPLKTTNNQFFPIISPGIFPATIIPAIALHIALLIICFLIKKILLQYYFLPLPNTLCHIIATSVQKKHQLYTLYHNISILRYFFIQFIKQTVYVQNRQRRRERVSFGQSLSQPYNDKKPASVPCRILHSAPAGNYFRFTNHPIFFQAHICLICRYRSLKETTLIDITLFNIIVL